MVQPTVQRDELGHDLPVGDIVLSPAILDKYIQAMAALETATTDAEYDAAENMFTTLRKSNRFNRATDTAYRNAALDLVDDIDRDEFVMSGEHARHATPEPEPTPEQFTDETRAQWRTVKATYDAVINAVRREVNDTGQKYLNTTAHATGTLDTGLYVSVTHNTNLNTLTIDATTGPAWTLTRIAEYDDNGRQSGLTNDSLARYPGAVEFLARIYAIVSDHLNPTEPTPPAEVHPTRYNGERGCLCCDREVTPDMCTEGSALCEYCHTAGCAEARGIVNHLTRPATIANADVPCQHKYANLPAISGGSHEHTAVIDAPTKKPRAKNPNRATSQARDNERAERDRIREQYRTAAHDTAGAMAAILHDAGFTPTEERESGDTPVTIWHDADGLATIKQTPYTVRIYNGRPARLGKKADAVFVNRVAHGWNPDFDYTPTGHAEGIAAFIKAHFAYDETTDYSYIDTPLTEEPIGDLLTVTASGERKPVTVSHAGPWQYPTISGGSHDHDTRRADCTELWRSDNGVWIISHAYNSYATPTLDCLELRRNYPNGASDVYILDGRHEPKNVPAYVRTKLAELDPYPTISGGSHDHTPDAQFIADLDPIMYDTDTGFHNVTQESPRAENIDSETVPTCPRCMSYRYDGTTCEACNETDGQPEPTGDRVTITHTPEDGTIATGDTRPQASTLKAHGWKWSRNLTAWYIPNSRDKAPQTAKITRTANALRDNHAAVSLDIDETAPDPDTAQRERIAATVATLPPCEHDTPEALAAELLTRYPLSVERANAAHQWSSFSPEKRAAGHLADYANTIERATAGLWPHATTPEQRAILAAKLDDFARMYNERYTAWLDALSRTASTMITGGSGFNHRRNAKALGIERRRCEELNEWTPAALKRILKALDAARTPEQAADAAFNALRKEIDEDLATIEQIERGELRYQKTPWVNGIAGRIQRAHKRGELDTVRRALAHLDAEQTRRNIKGITKRHSIWKLATI